ncbi:EAL domain-containing protein [Caulobacter segnis]|uniref:EAL domain-containing protein n=1 Tax=Caulobacter segnis TaxID=88688 RepID=UPI00240F9724|nr:EAL domain-containing protein [Caulobacter segnis]MDG2520264.1 EAL domain-containing protein [Caulobacter segnis]
MARKTSSVVGFPRSSSAAPPAGKPQAFFLRITNLGDISAAYGEGGLVRVLWAAWSRVASLSWARMAQGGMEADGVVFRLATLDADPGPAWREEVLRAVCAEPVEVGSAVVMPAAEILDAHYAQTATPAARARKSPGAGWVEDMASAAALHAAVVQERLEFRFQAVRSADGATILYEPWVVFVVGADGERTDLETFRPGIEGLGLTRYLDWRLVRHAIAFLRCVPDLQLGCPISAASARLDEWWIGILAELVAEPDVARRLVLEMRPIARDMVADAKVFIEEVQGLGVRCALQGVGVELTLDQARRAGARIVKLQAPGAEGPAETLRAVVDAAQTVTPDVIIPGGGDRAVAARARAAGAPWIEGPADPRRDAKAAARAAGTSLEGLYARWMAVRPDQSQAG